MLCDFDDNLAQSYGGGIANLNGSEAAIISCEFTFNEAGFGAAIYNRYASQTTIVDSHFEDNNSNGSAGAITDRDNCDSEIERCTFKKNRSLLSGGAFWFSNSSPTVKNCEFSENKSTYSIAGAGLVDNGASPTFDNCLFADKSVPKW